MKTLCISIALCLPVLLLLAEGFPSTSAGNEKNRKCLIAIDIGHSKNHPGARSARGIFEFEFNKRIAGIVNTKLKAGGYDTVSTTVPQGTDDSPQRRAHIVNKAQATLLISIHHDSVQERFLEAWVYNGRKEHFSDIFRGFSLFYSPENRFTDKSLELAILLGDQLLLHGFSPTLHHADPVEGENRPLVDARRGIYTFSNLALLKRVKVPAVLLECGVIVNRHEEITLSDVKTQERIASAIVRASTIFCRKYSR